MLLLLAVVVRVVVVVGAVVVEELLRQLGRVRDEVDLVPDHCGLPEKLDLAHDDRRDEPQHGQLRDDPLPLGRLLLALLLERVAVDELATGLGVAAVVVPSILGSRAVFKCYLKCIIIKLISCTVWASY